MAKKPISSQHAKSAFKTLLGFTGQQVKKGAVATKKGIETAAKKASPHVAKAKKSVLGWYRGL